MFHQNQIKTARPGNRRVSKWLMASAIAFTAASPIHAVKYKALDFWGVGGFAHDSRPAANTLLDSLAKVMDITIDKTDQATAFTTANLAQYQVVIMNNTTEPGKILNIDQRAALLGFMKTKGFVGFHGSGDAKGTWPDYTAYLGGELSTHGGGIATLNIDPACEAKNSDILKGLPTQIKFNEEWYAYRTNPRLTPGVQVLFTLDESTCPNCTTMPGGDHPIAWTKTDPAGGRTFYYAMGHGNSIFQKNEFAKVMLKQAIQWAGGELPLKPSGCGTGLEPMAKSVETMVQVKAGRASMVVQIGREGVHSVRIHSLTGKSIANLSGNGIRSYAFDKLESGALYSVVVTTGKISQSNLVAVP